MDLKITNKMKKNVFTFSECNKIDEVYMPRTDAEWDKLDSNQLELIQNIDNIMDKMIEGGYLDEGRKSAILDLLIKD